jgi:hypothetical protein
LCAFSETIDERRRDALAAQDGVFDLREAQFQGVIFILSLVESALEIRNPVGSSIDLPAMTDPPFIRRGNG